jgi:hypothetical protein
MKVEAVASGMKINEDLIFSVEFGENDFAFGIGKNTNNSLVKLEGLMLSEKTLQVMMELFQEKWNLDG